MLSKPVIQDNQQDEQNEQNEQKDQNNQSSEAKILLRIGTKTLLMSSKQVYEISVSLQEKLTGINDLISYLGYCLLSTNKLLLKDVATIPSWQANNTTAAGFSVDPMLNWNFLSRVLGKRKELERLVLKVKAFLDALNPYSGVKKGEVKFTLTEFARISDWLSGHTKYHLLHDAMPSADVPFEQHNNGQIVITDPSDITVVSILATKLPSRAVQKHTLYFLQQPVQPPPQEPVQPPPQEPVQESQEPPKLLRIADLADLPDIQIEDVEQYIPRVNCEADDAAEFDDDTPFGEADFNRRQESMCASRCASICLPPLTKIIEILPEPEGMLLFCPLPSVHNISFFNVNASLSTPSPDGYSLIDSDHSQDVDPTQFPML